MKPKFNLTVLIIGLSGIVAQVLLLRELLVSLYGNELTLGIILANWIISEALGVFILGKFIERIKNKTNVFITLQVIFSTLLPLSIYLSRIFKNILGIPFGETVGLYAIFYSSLLIIFPIGFCHGGLFSLAAIIYSSLTKEPAHSIGKIYAWETIGTIIGGIILTYLFIPYLNSFQMVFIVALANLVICLFFFKDTSKILKYTALLLILCIGSLSLSGGIDCIHRLSIKRQWRMQEVLDYRNSIYGNIVATKKGGQYTFFYNGIPIITLPYPDITFVQEFANLPLLFHHNPKEILVISAGAGGLINEILKHPIKRLDYAELDPLIIDMLKKYHTPLTQRELNDPRVNIIHSDGRFFVKNTPRKYDVVLIGLSKPSDLSTNRLFTQEFFSLVKKRLNPDGILAFCLPGSLSYISQELKDINACILNGLKNSYSFVRIIPGDYNMFFASDSKDILEVTPNLITQRINQNNIKTDILIPNYLDYRLNKRWIDWFEYSLKGATSKINRDLAPFAVFEMIVLWNKQFSHLTGYILAAVKNLNLMIVAVLIFLLTFILFYISYYQRRSTRLSIAYCITTTGFFGMLANLILIFSFQVYYGYLYHRIGILMSIFMAGIALGSICMTKGLGKIRDNFSLFIKLELVIVIFAYLLAWLINSLFTYGYYSSLFFSCLFFILGLLVGLEFPLASKIYLGEKEEVGITAGILYGADLMGGWLAGILGGVVLLPVLGLFNTCMVIVLFKLSSLVLLISTKKRLSALIA